MEETKTSTEFDNLLEKISNLSISSEEKIELLSALALYIASR